MTHNMTVCLRLCNQVVSGVRKHFDDIVSVIPSCSHLEHEDQRSAQRVGKPVILYDAVSKIQSKLPEPGQRVLQKNNTDNASSRRKENFRIGSAQIRFTYGATPNTGCDKEALGWQRGSALCCKASTPIWKTTSGGLKTSVVEGVTNMLRIPLEMIETNHGSPAMILTSRPCRNSGNPSVLHDIIQPVTVSRLPTGKYRLISGERRFRAARIAELKDIPAYVRQADDLRCWSWPAGKFWCEEDLERDGDLAEL